MNYYFKTIILLFSIFLLSCESDNNNTTNYENFVIFNNNKVELDKAYISVEDYYAELVFFSEGIDIDQQVGGVVGQGITIEMIFFSTLPTLLGTETYVLDANIEHNLDSFYYSNTDVSPLELLRCNADSPLSEPCLSGIVEVTSGGLTELTLTFDLTDENGNQITGEWTGDITVIQ